MTTSSMSTRLIAFDRQMAVGIVCLFLGLGLVVGVGFAGSAAVHDAAHDTRHAIGFPCH
jgi:cobalt transporter subunit CbtB